jgi:serine-type D-Ala-D-Ala carboxypeptidase (penicillin-binding protein 5/6)
MTQTYLKTPLMTLALAAACLCARAQENVSYICVEAETGLVLSEHNADLPRPPASMVKMALMLMVAEGLEQGEWTLETPVNVSKYAESMGGTQVFLKHGEVFPLDKMMQAVAVASANDAALAVAEELWGSKEAYLEAVNARVLELGMSESKFYSVHGLPPEPGDPFDRTTARDMALLARHCIARPVIMGWVGLQEIQFRPGDAAKTNTNKLLTRMVGCDGLKTGYIRAAGFCLTSTAVRDGIRLVGVVMGHGNNEARFAAAEELLEGIFPDMSRRQLLALGQEVDPPVRIRNSAEGSLRLVAGDDIWLAMREQDRERLEIVSVHPARLRTPLDAGAVAGEAVVRIGDQTLATVPLVTPKPVPAPGWRWKLGQSAMRAVN